jgi:hypothetical protein
VATDIVRNFTSAGGVTDQHRITNVQVIQQRRKIICVPVHVISVPGLAGTPVTPTIMRYHPIPTATEEQHLGVPCVGTEWPPVGENYRLSVSPILIEKIGTII